MRALIIGGTGTISTAIVNLLAKTGWELVLLNRGKRAASLPQGAKRIQADINDAQDVAQKIGNMRFDAVCQFIGFCVEDVKRDFRLFHGRTRQYLFISSASAYHKPAKCLRITEGTSLANPYWQYSRDKIACEEYLMRMYREEGFPVTIVRPSHTYDEKKIPVAVHGKNGFWQVIKRMREEKPVIIHGDGSSLWTVTFSTDFAAGFAGLMGNPQAIGEAFQITSDESLSWDQIYQTIAEALGVPFKPYHVSSDFLAAAGGQYGLRGGLLGDKAVSVLFDNRKIKQAVPGFCPSVSFAQGVRRSLAYILAHEECQVEDPEFDAWCDRVIAVLEQAKKNFEPA
ncbi:MAG: SDR family oxidoreductase [Eubacterium sp.]|nr:SDR family oxidoreductase [Eubacterium sp.]